MRATRRNGDRQIQVEELAVREDVLEAKGVSLYPPVGGLRSELVR